LKGLDIRVYILQVLSTASLNVDHHASSQWSLSIRVQTTLNHIWFVFYHNIKDIKRNLCQDLLTIENTNSDLKVHSLHYANELLVRIRLSFQKLLQTRSTCRNNKKNVWEKSNDTYSFSITVQTTLNHISNCFLPQY